MDRKARNLRAEQIQQSLLQEEGSLTELLTTGFRRALVVGILLAGLSQASGIFSLLSFLPEVLKAAGADTSGAFFQTVLVGVILAIFTLVSMSLVDVAGRKTLILVGTLLQFISFRGRRVAVLHPRQRLGHTGVRHGVRGGARRRQRRPCAG